MGQLLKIGERPNAIEILLLSIVFEVMYIKWTGTQKSKAN